MSPLGDRLLVKPEEEAKVHTALIACLSSVVLMSCKKFMCLSSYTANFVPRQKLTLSVLNPCFQELNFFLRACLCLLLTVSVDLTYFAWTQTTSGGLLLSSGTTKPIQEALIGEVLSVGEDVDIDVKVGSKVLFSKYSSSDVKSANGDVSFVAQKSILATLS